MNHSGHQKSHPYIQGGFFVLFSIHLFSKSKKNVCPPANGGFAGGRLHFRLRSPMREAPQDLRLLTISLLRQATLHRS